jgi:hypothetical protein
MATELGRLRTVMIGVSGTGSVVAEQLARLGIGQLTLIDFDRVELKHLNRILNMRRGDALESCLKVEAFAEAVVSHRGQGVAVPVAKSVTTREAVLAAAQGDVLFCCVDTLEAWQIADLIASAFLLPLFDMGVVIPMRKAGEGVAIADVCGRIDYAQPGGTTLQDRGVCSPESVRGAYLRRVAPEAHEQELMDGYLKGLPDEAPGVITLNMRAGSACVSEFLARAYPFRLEPNALYARTQFSLAACDEEYQAEDTFTRSPNPALARGDLELLLGLPTLAVPDLMRGLATLIRRWWRNTRERLGPARRIRVIQGDSLPPQLPRRDLVLAREEGEDWCVGMHCPCGCRQVIELLIVAEAGPRWGIKIDGRGRPTLSPLSGFVTGAARTFGCGPGGSMGVETPSDSRPRLTVLTPRCRGPLGRTSPRGFHRKESREFRSPLR